MSEEMKIFGFQVQGEDSEWQIDMPSGAKLALRFKLDLEDMDTVHDFVNYFGSKVRAHLTEESWTPSDRVRGDGFLPDRPSPT